MTEALTKELKGLLGVSVLSVLMAIPLAGLASADPVFRYKLQSFQTDETPPVTESDDDVILSMSVASFACGNPASISAMQFYRAGRVVAPIDVSPSNGSVQSSEGFSWQGSSPVVFAGRFAAGDYPDRVDFTTGDTCRPSSVGFDGTTADTIENGGTPDHIVSYPTVDSDTPDVSLGPVTNGRTVTGFDTSWTPGDSPRFRMGERWVRVCGPVSAGSTSVVGPIYQTGGGRLICGMAHGTATNPARSLHELMMTNPNTSVFRIGMGRRVIGGHILYTYTESWEYQRR